MAKKFKVGLLGCGSVGRGLVELIGRNHDVIRQRSGVELSITRILVRDAAKERPGVDRDLITTSAEKVINNGCDMVVELVGGIEPARSLIEGSLEQKKHVVTANKALLAVDGFRLLQAAESQNVRLGFEASVCGGIPIIRALRNGLVGNQIQSLAGILNGTCNYILTRMTEDRAEFGDALSEAQQKGFAEADPSLDIDGHDAAQKLKILAELAFNAQITAEAVSTEGIRNLTAEDVRAARDLGLVIKHVATAELNGDSICLQARPVLLPSSHQLAGVREENNAVLVRGDAVGDMMFSGKGAGPLPSASAVLSDIVDIACHQGGFSATHDRTLDVHSPQQNCQHYLRVPVNHPSAIGPITAVLERHGIGIARASAVWAKNAESEHQVQVFTHAVASQALRNCLPDIGALGVPGDAQVLLPVLT